MAKTSSETGTLLFLACRAVAFIDQHCPLVENIYCVFISPKTSGLGYMVVVLKACSDEVVKKKNKKEPEQEIGLSMCQGTCATALFLNLHCDISTISTHLLLSYSLFNWTNLFRTVLCEQLLLITLWKCGRCSDSALQIYFNVNVVTISKLCVRPVTCLGWTTQWHLGLTPAPPHPYRKNSYDSYGWMNGYVFLMHILLKWRWFRNHRNRFNM